MESTNFQNPDFLRHPTMDPGSRARHRFTPYIPFFVCQPRFSHHAIDPDQRNPFKTEGSQGDFFYRMRQECVSEHDSLSLRHRLGPRWTPTVIVHRWRVLCPEPCPPTPPTTHIDTHTQIHTHRYTHTNVDVTPRGEGTFTSTARGRCTLQLLYV